MNSVTDLMGAITAEGVKFVQFVYRAKESHEVSRIVVELGHEVSDLYKADVAILSGMAGVVEGVELIAVTELLKSREESLTVGIGHNSQYVHENTFGHLKGLKGISIHHISGELYITGLVHAKEVLQMGEHKTVNSSLKTVAKNKVRRTLPSGKFRRYALGNVISAKVNGDTLILHTVG